MSQAMPRSVQFRREREASWRELEGLLERAEASGPRALDAHQMMRLPILYRAAVSSLSVARAISLDRSLLEYLESLVGRAYVVVYGRPESPGATIGDFFTTGFPRAVRSVAPHLFVCFLLMVGGALTGHLMTDAEPDRFSSFVPLELAGDRGPFSSREELRAGLYAGDEHGDADLINFSAFLFQHNARIGIAAFAFGALLGLPVVYLMFSTGLMLGAFSSIHHAQELGFAWWGWVMPHGVTELGAVLLCGAAGLSLGHALIDPGPRPRLRALALASRRASLVVLGAVLMFFLAGAIEGIFRQRVQDDVVRYAVSTSSLLLWTWYFLRAGRMRRDDD